MKNILMPLLAAAILAVPSFVPQAAAQSAKKLLVVTTTTGFRHDHHSSGEDSIHTGERIITQLGQSSGAFTVDFIHQPPDKPADLRRGATADERAAHNTAETAWEETLKTALQKLSPESLKNYDGVVFLCTTGDLPIPDKDGFLAWIKGGGAFIGIHAAADTFHGWPGYIDMLGGEFMKHGAQLSVECLNVDPQFPANLTLSKSLNIVQEEVYQFKNYDPAKVHELLILDKHPEADRTPGHFPVSWCKDYGKGKVFYTSLGHREDIWDTDPDLKFRKNPVEVGQAYQAHLLGGIKWALGLVPGSAKLPQ